MSKKCKLRGPLFALATAFTAGFALAQERPNYPPQFDDAKAVLYKTVGDVKLYLYVFEPPGHKPDDRRPAIVFFFGGGWRSGSPAQFQQQCRHLAARGMVAMAADYRVASRHNVQPVQCVADAKSAIRYVRSHAVELGIDPERVAAGGGSAGGHLAACAGVIRGLDEEGENTAVSSVPNALVLFNPALVLAEVDGDSTATGQRLAALRDRLGDDPKKISPYHHVAKGAPPTLILHGKDDRTVPYRTAELFAKAMQQAGNLCELVGYEGQEHGFFNYGRGENKYYRLTLAEMDRFLTKLGYLKDQHSP